VDNDFLPTPDFCYRHTCHESQRSLEVTARRVANFLGEHSPGWLGGNPPPRWGAPGEDKVDRGCGRQARGRRAPGAPKEWAG
jgi:hypothetical protein